MTVPEPHMKLEGHCSVIHSNTLYVYSPNGFESISLAANATWNKLPSGVSVSGAACVIAAVEGNTDDEAMYVIGGISNSSSYEGLQRYAFSQQKWETLSVQNMANRTSHGAGYIESIASIVVYAGNQDSGTGDSSATYLMSTTSPYSVDSKNNQGAPAVSSPMLLTWNSSAVALIGGSDLNTDIYIYGATSGWMYSGATLPSAIPTSSRCALLWDDDGNRVLEEFSMDASPNTVTSYDLVKEGIAQNPAPKLGDSSSKRSLSSYSTYNSTYAPTNKWTDYSVAHGTDGLVVLSSGSGNNSLAVFNGTSDSWVNATELFYGNTQNVLKTTTSTTTTSTSTPTSTSTSTTSSATSSTTSSATVFAAAPTGSSKLNTKLIIGATLGSLVGFAIILIAILLIIRRVQKKRQGSGRGADDKDRLSFQDRGIEPLAERGYPMAKSPVPVAEMSSDSLAILSGRLAGEKALKPPVVTSYGPTKHGWKSPLSTIPSSGFAPSSTYSLDSDRPGTPGDRTTDEGWGKYFEENSEIVETQPDRSTMGSLYTKSDYRSSAWPMNNLTPLNLAFLDQPKPLGQVISGSPTTQTHSPQGKFIIPESQSARISSADSISTLATDDDPHDTKWTQNNWLGPRPPAATTATVSTIRARGISRNHTLRMHLYDNTTVMDQPS
ncbi:hypothetical protein N7495_005627 [Penicillium taxi]|uniref:uncharacterized protein n=1 Tax=Penicillium taxi TaxID=168475 RepID=UPI0025452C65|nr:uncharacterized protein N7495_005627 [Penicillium taxi]KAJ5893936.1 hypothetical protein N7495_005627 [Penicillium taxi]